MEITSIRYGRKFNLGNYESEEIAFEGVLDDGESPMDCLTEMKAAVLEAFKSKEEAPVQEAPTATKKKTSKKKAAKKVEPAPEEEEEEEFIDDDTEEEPAKPVAKKTTKKKAAKKATGKKTTKKKASRKKKTPYDRNLALHKKLVGEMLAEELPDWKEDSAIKALVKKASVEMEGEDFLDDGGAILESFREEFISLTEE